MSTPHPGAGRLDPKRQGVLIGVAVAVVAAALILTGVTLANHGSARKQAAPGGPALPASTAAPTAASASAGQPTATADAGAPGSGPPTSLHSSTLAAAVVTGAGAALTRPGSPTEKPAPAAADCRQLLDQGYDLGSCEVVHDARSRATAYAMTEIGGGTERALVWAADPSGVHLALRATNEGGGGYARVSVTEADIVGDGDQKALFTYSSSPNQGQATSVDVVDAASATVVIHRDLGSGGSFTTGGGMLLTYTPEGPAFRRDTIGYDDGAWRVVGSATVPSGQVPPTPS